MHALTLCLLTHTPTKYHGSYCDFICQAIQGGVTSVQLRDKSSNKKEISELARALKKTLSPFNIPLLLNDHLDIAKEIDADGIHVGQSDVSAMYAREVLGPNKIIGLSIETLEELAIANTYSCLNYVAASATFESKTKTNCKTIWGLDGVKQLAASSKYPVIAIGGINEHNAHTVIKSGAAGIAVVGAIHHSDDPRLAAQKLIHAIKGEAHA